MKAIRTKTNILRLLCPIVILLSASLGLQAEVRITSVTGTVTIYDDATGKSRQAKEGDVLQSGESVVTSYLSEADFNIDGAEVRLGETSSIPGTYEEGKEKITLNYGVLSGVVPRTATSALTVSSALGTVAIKTGEFKISSIFSVISQQMSFRVSNIDGRVALNSRYSGTLEYGRGYSTVKSFRGDMPEKFVDIPPKHSVEIQLSAADPYFFDLVDFSNLHPEASSNLKPFKVEIPTYTPDDYGIQVSPSSSRPRS